jgi:hypothetical protein
MKHGWKFEYGSWGRMSKVEMPTGTPQYWLINFLENAKCFISHDGPSMRIEKKVSGKVLRSFLIGRFEHIHPCKLRISDLHKLWPWLVKVHDISDTTSRGDQCLYSKTWQLYICLSKFKLYFYLQLPCVCVGSSFTFSKNYHTNHFYKT